MRRAEDRHRGLPQRGPDHRRALRRTRLGRIQPTAGDKRASAAKDFLVQLGFRDKLKTISYGKERPQCTEQDESCWQKNRRVHFSTGQ